MPAQSIKDKFINLPLPHKIIGIGSVFTIISAFLPWYRDIDVFNNGLSFLGVTGPLYLVGYLIIALSLFSLILTGFYLLEKKLPPLPLKESHIYILSGSFALFLLIIASSVYFHPEFGINITSKEYQIGMILAFLGSIAITVGGVLQQKETGTSRLIKEFQEETQEVDPVLELNNFQKEQEIEKEKQETMQKEVIEKPEPVTQNTPQPKPQTSFQPSIRPKPSTGVREYKAKPDSTEPPTKIRQEPYPDPAKIRREREVEYGGGLAGRINNDSEKVNPNSVIRTDL